MTEKITDDQAPSGKDIDMGGLMAGEFGDTASTVSSDTTILADGQKQLTEQELRDRVFGYISEGRYE